MTEPIDDGWPDKYRDPRDRPHPSVLRITVESFERMRDETLEAIEGISEDEEQPAVVSFRTVGELRKILTDRRIELLRALMTTDGAAESISAFADDLDRDYSTVHDDVSLLAEHGMLFIVDDGQSKRPYIPYDRIHIDVEFAGQQPDEEPAPA
jgi:predicted transcriptional regulator